MAGSSLLALIDDIAMLLDDVAVMSKVAVKKTAGVLGDDLALNAEQVSGVRPERELPVVWAVAKGSAINKVILVPAALAIAALEAWLKSMGWNVPLIIPLLMIGGAFLCFEGCEKLVHKLLHSKKEDDQHHKDELKAFVDPNVDLVAFERDKIKGAIRTDFILSAEIIVITLGTVAAATFGKQVAVLCTIAAVMTVGVYGLVAGIVKLDDAGLHLSKKSGAQAAFGRGILKFAPYLMKSLSILGTAAMFMVGGAIMVHGIPAVHHWVQAMGVAAADVGGASLDFLTQLTLEAGFGILVGLILVALFSLGKKMFGKKNPSAAAGH